MSVTPADDRSEWQAGEERARAAALLDSVLLSVTAILVASGLVGLAGLFAKPLLGTALVGSLLLLVFAARWVMKRGRVYAASWMFIGSIWALCTVAIVLLGTPNTAAVAAYVAVMTVAGLMVGAKALVGVAAASILVAAGMTVAAGLGYPPPAIVPMLPSNGLWWLMLSVAGTAVPLHLTLRSKQDAMDRAAREIVDRQRAEQEVRRLNESLEARVTERTAALERALQEIQSFSYTVSHDIRAPLRHLIAYVELGKTAAGPTLADDAREYLDRAARSGERLAQMVDELLEFSRVGRAAVRTAPVDLSELAGEVLADARHELAGRAVQWTVGRLPTVLADRTLIKLVLTNYVANAVKFSRERPLAGIEIGARDDVPGEWTVWVRDNGAGFDPRFADKLFGVFQRLHSPSEFEGSGIGLATCKRIVERHGGRVWAQGAPGDGATFYFSLPSRLPAPC